MIGCYVDIEADKKFSSVGMLSIPISYLALDWAKENCKSYITNMAVKKENDCYYYRFYFSDEKDRLLFMLRWS